MSDTYERLLYESGLVAQGCWDELDEYTQSAIMRFYELAIREACNVLNDWKYEPFPFDEDIAQELLQKHFGVKDAVR